MTTRVPAETVSQRRVGAMPDRILVIVPHEPDADPRVKWVTNLCTEFSRTDIIGYTYTIDKPFCEYDGTVYTERVSHRHYSFLVAKLLRKGVHLLSFSFRLVQHPVRTLRGSTIVQNLIRTRLGLHDPKTGNPPKPASPRRDYGRPPFGEERKPVTRMQKVAAAIQTQAIILRHFLGSIEIYVLIAGTLYRRLRGNSIIPRFIICHDIYALGAAVKLKKVFRCPVLYDSHEFWPEADLEAVGWEKRAIARLEQQLIRRADVVVTVTPQIARHLERTYGISGVVSAPNAEPFMPNGAPSSGRAISLPLKFLLQGGAAPGRGIEELLELWKHVKDPRAVLILRCPENDYVEYLRTKIQREIKTGEIIMAKPVTEDELVAAAGSADVGIIPYGGPSLNHLYACPNKLSQYMQAGLAILANADLQFVSQITTELNCGRSYDATKPETLLRAVNEWLDHPEQLQSMKEKGYQGAERMLNWEVQSKAYKEAIGRLFTEKRGVA